MATLTDSEKMELKNDIKKDVLSELKAGSTSEQELEEVQSLDNIDSLPAARGNEMVKVPLKLLGKEATDAAKEVEKAMKELETIKTDAKAVADMKDSLTQLKTQAETAVQDARQVTQNFQSTSLAALRGATVRFAGFDTERRTVEQASATPTDAVGVFFNTVAKCFLLKKNAGDNFKYYRSWQVSEGKFEAHTMYQTDTSAVLTDKIFVCKVKGKDKFYTFSQSDGLVEFGGNNTGNTINMAMIAPLPVGQYYTLETAIKAVPSEYRGLLRCITFPTEKGAETKQFLGTSIDSWESAASWGDFGSGGKIKSVLLNGQKLTPSEDGAVSINIDTIEVDSSLNKESTNPVQNKVIAEAIEGMKNPTFNADVDTDDEGSTVTLTTESGHQVAQFKVQGGGGGTSTTSKIVLTANVDNSKVKEGGHSTLSWVYNHVNADGAEDGVVGDVILTIKRGSVTLHEETLTGVNPSAVAHTVVLDAWLKEAGTVGAYISATANADGSAQKKSFYVPVNVVSLDLVLTNVSSIVGAIASGGYADGSIIDIAYAVKGSGEKVVNMYIDGGETPTTQTVTKSGTTNGSFAIQAKNLSPGRHTVQLVAENGNILSKSSYIDILKAGDAAPFIGIYFTSEEGRVFHADWRTPTIVAKQYEQSSFQYIAYDPSHTPATLVEYQNDVQMKSFAAARSLQTYSNRYTGKDTIEERFVCGTTEYRFNIDVQKSSIDISKATAGLVFELSAAGRSNGESNPAVWENKGITTSFQGVDWKSSGWNGDALVLRNGAKAVVSYLPFDETQDPASVGKTIEMEFKISNVTKADADVISCIHKGKGFRVTGEKVSMLTGSSVSYHDEDGNEQNRIVGVEKYLAEDLDIKLALMIGKRSEYRLMELYMNGTREKADIYNTDDNFVQAVPQGITFDSANADIELRSIRVYNRAISDDEEVDNYIVDRKTSEEMLKEFDKNDVLDDNGKYDINKILAKGKGVVRFIRKGGLDEVNSTNNKKKDFLTDFIYYSPFGREWDLKVEGCYVRIQGTSSTKYPRKNYRIYLLKPGTVKISRRTKEGAWYLVEDFKGWSIVPEGILSSLICLKADYSDSSMTMNTGGARLFDEMMRSLGLLTPPQEHDKRVRQAIDGFPVDVFSSESEDGSIEYYGQYNFNNDKSKSGDLFGHSNVSGFDTSKSVALEFLNNGSRPGQFQSAGSADSSELLRQMQTEFDDALEFNFPEDFNWSTIDNKVPGTQKALLRLFGWVYDCIQECVKKNGLDLSKTDYKNISLFRSDKFKAELYQYFPVEHLLGYYLWTDYHMSVDQRVKNIIMRTWDLIHWYMKYYDGDCAFGKRNDSFLKYLYTLSRDTWDADKSKYAFEGHNSWLWCLLLANFSDELRAMAKKMRGFLTNEKEFDMWNVKQMGNWCARAYNKSGEFKYIIPATKGVKVIKDGVETDGVTYPYIYALDGTNYAHRVNIIKKRFSLLDAYYGCDSYKDDNVEMYISRLASDPIGHIRITANSIYYFDWNTKNGSHTDTKKADTGETISLDFTGQITVNDPVDLYGASRMEKLDLSGVAASVQNGVNLNKALVLKEIDAHSDRPCSQSWWFNFENCQKIEVIDCTNQQGVKTGTSSSTEFDVTNQTRLRTLRLGGTKVQGIVLADGAPVEDLVLPETLTTLKLRYLPLLDMSHLNIQGYDNVTTMIFASCPNLDWQELLSRCPNVTRLRIEGVNITDDGSFLEKYKHFKGVDAEGNAVSTCQLIGDIYLTAYIADEQYDQYKAIYPNLNIHQPDYTTFEFDDSVSDDRNVSNLDNKTGYKFGNAFAMSGHRLRIAKMRHRVLAKMTDKGKVMTYFPLHDSNSNFYADAENVSGCSAAKLDSTEGDVMMYEPHYWFKGVNDFLNNKHWSCYSSNEQMPPRPKATILTFDDIQGGGDLRKGYKVMSGKPSITDAYATDGNYSTCRVQVSGYKKVRFPTVPGASLVGSVFTNADGKVLKSIVVPTLTNKFNPGMYLIDDIPSDAVNLYFTIKQTAPFDCVVLSNSDNILDMEPDWVEHQECLTAVFGSTVIGSKLRSCVSGGSTTGNLSWTDFHFYSEQRGMQQIDYEMHRDIANLFFTGYGRRDSQSQCGAGQHSETRKTGGTAEIGMQDTVNTDGNTVGGVDGNNSLAFYEVKTNDGLGSFVRLNNTNCLGYEDIYGHKWDMMDKVGVPNGSGEQGVWYIEMPDGSTRKVQGATTGLWITAVVHGKYMDIIPAGGASGSSSTFYCDRFEFSGAASRVVFRGYYSASANGGVAYSDAFYDASGSWSSVGSRLAFRGRLVKAKSVATFKAITEVA